jgi:predicted ATP-binding protein involved in virulence
MRTKGNIDIPRENSLAKDRLVSLFFNEKEERNTNFTNINDKNIVDSICIIFDKENVERKYNELIEKWKKEKTVNTDEYFDLLKDFIIDKWKKKHKFSALNSDDERYQTAVLYLAYKTISIARTYNSLLENSDWLIPIPDGYWTLERHEKFEKLMTEIEKDKSHITFKLRQTLAYLKFRHIPLNNEGIIPIDRFAQLVKDKINDDWTYLDFVPCPIFKTEIQLKEKNSSDIYPFSRLSSGERQLVYTTSSILYHIRNLNSIGGSSRRVKYKQLNIVLDEIELYFHPEFQRRFVDYLIKCIESLQFKDIKSINIQMLTHSPFILSDIPETNVLFLEKGKPQVGISETFGANIHSLYRNNFFIEGMPIGEFAKNKINELFDKVRKIKNEDKILYDEIRLVGESLLRSQLLKLYAENCSSDLFDRIEKLENELKILKEKND